MSKQVFQQKTEEFICYIVMNMIKIVVGLHLKNVTMADLTDENDIRPEWGRYLLNNTDRYIHKNPEIMIYGNDESRSNWFDKKDLANTAELIMNRYDMPISATMVRTAMAKDDRKLWMSYVNPRLHKMYDELREELMTVEFYKNLAKE